MDPALDALHARYDQALTFCVHVHNRLHQLRQTLPRNLELVRASRQVGIVVLDYNSRDGLDAWIRAEYADAIAAGTLIFGRESTARFFHASRSKNLAHRLGPGRVLVNLDADNVIGETLPFLLDLAKTSENLLVHQWSGVWQDGTYGRIAVSRALFHRLHGYDESFLPMGHQDTDLVMRARLAGADVIAIAGSGFGVNSGLRIEAIPNTKREALQHTGYSMSFDTMNQINTWLGRWQRRFRGPVANPRGWGCARVTINFATDVDLR